MVEDETIDGLIDKVEEVFNNTIRRRQCVKPELLKDIRDFSTPHKAETTQKLPGFGEPGNQLEARYCTK